MKKKEDYTWAIICGMIAAEGIRFLLTAGVTAFGVWVGKKKVKKILGKEGLL